MWPRATGRSRTSSETQGIPVHITGHYSVDAEHYLGRVSELAAILSLWEPDAVLANTLGVFPAVDAALGMDLPIFWAIHESFTIKTWAYLNWGEQGVHPQVEQRWRACLRAARSVFESEATLAMYKETIPTYKGLSYGTASIAPASSGTEVGTTATTSAPSSGSDRSNALPSVWVSSTSERLRSAWLSRLPKSLSYFRPHNSFWWATILPSMPGRSASQSSNSVCRTRCASSRSSPTPTDGTQRRIFWSAPQTLSRYHVPFLRRCRSESPLSPPTSSDCPRSFVMVRTVGCAEDVVAPLS